MWNVERDKTSHRREASCRSRRRVPRRSVRVKAGDCGLRPGVRGKRALDYVSPGVLTTNPYRARLPLFSENLRFYALCIYLVGKAF